MKYSIIILHEEPHDEFDKFVRSIFDAFSLREEPFELLIMANGTGGFLRNQLPSMHGINNQLKAFEFATATSQAVCLKAILSQIKGEILVVCGTYQQISNQSLMEAVDALDEDVDIVAPRRQKQIDTSFNQFWSRVFNITAHKITGFDLRDLSCAVKVFRREVLQETELYGNMYQFLPILAAQKGFRTKEIKCEHNDEHGKTRFYKLSEYINQLIDIFTLYFNTRFTKKPLRFFSFFGVGFMFGGLILNILLFVQRFVYSIPIGNRPALFIALLLMILGVLVASVGLLGEIITFTNGRHKRQYTIEKTI